MLFKNSVPTSKKTQRVSVTKINWLMLFSKIIAVCSANHTKPTNILWGQKLKQVVHIATTVL
jgi:uracil DNA glycosylase